jgi:gag-polypeptide of LTR copia-type/Domain of unknown function (DUF4219)/Zinc knuckle
MSASTGSITTSVFERIAALDGTNYRSWAFSMKMLLKAHELWEVIEDDDTDEDGTSATGPEKGKGKKPDAKWRKKDQLALSNIALALKPSEQEHIYNCVTAKDAWNCLKQLYEGKGTHRFLSLLKSISTAKLEDGVKMKEYIRGVRQIATQLSEIDVKFEKIAVIGFILNGLPDHYRYLVVNLESQVETISYEDLSARLMDEENRLIESVGSGLKSDKLSEDFDTVAAHFVKLKGLICHSCKQRGHIAKECPDKSKSMTCEWCGESGHDEENCKIKKYQRSKTDKSDKYRRAYAALGVCDDGFTVPAY